MDSPATPPPAGLGRTSLLFLLCFILAQADKQVMGLLSIPVQKAFLLSDAQLGLLQGGAFAIAYALGGIPVARLLDTGNRVRIAALCVALWSIATIACGFATSFAMLILFRAATAVAEAALPPAAFSIFSQSGDARAAARLTSNFMLAPYIGGGLMLLLGGVLLKSMSDGGSIAPWQAVFLAVGIPGLLIAPVVAWLGQEPKRPSTPLRQHASAMPSIGKVFRAIFVESAFLRSYYLGLMAFYVITAALIAWYPTLLVRRFAISTAEAGAYAGIIYLVAGVAGTLAVGLMARLGRELSIRSLVKGFCVAASLLTLVALLLPVAPTLIISLACYAAYAFLSAAVTSSMAVPIQLSLPNNMQARGTAIASLLMSAVAGSAGPIIVGILSARAILPLPTALATVGGLCTLAAAAFLFRALQALQDDKPPT